MFKKLRQGLVGGVQRDEDGMEERKRDEGRDISRSGGDRGGGGGGARHPAKEGPRLNKEGLHAPKRAFKYTYDVHKETWKSNECVVMIAKKSFQEGGMRKCHKMYEIDKHGNHSPGVAKIFKDDVTESEEELMKAYFDEAMTQTVADTLAQQFNEFCTERRDLQCRFLPVCVMHIQDDQKKATLLNSEPYLKGEYVKHNDNDGHVETAFELPQAFSHFTWEFSKTTLLVCDIQGVGNFFTDPQIHSHDGESFSMGNLGQAGLHKFFKSHKCNNICRLIGLAKPVLQNERWVIGQGSQCQVRRTVLRSKRAENGAGRDGSTPPTTDIDWTAGKYDGALQQAASKIKDKQAKMQQAGAVEAPQLSMKQLEQLQNKLAKLIRHKNGSSNEASGGRSASDSPDMSRGSPSSMSAAGASAGRVGGERAQ